MRVFDYDAVIGIGGVSPWKDDKGIKYKVNWIGIGPKRISPHNESKINKVVFSKFELFEENGEDIEKKYPNLFDFMYVKKKRFSLCSSFPPEVAEEVNMILNSVKNAPASKCYDEKEININDGCNNSDNNKPTSKCRKIYEPETC